jgi:hypothetical protein
LWIFKALQHGKFSSPRFSGGGSAAGEASRQIASIAARPDSCAGRESVAGPASAHIGREFGADEHHGAQASTDLIFREHKSKKLLKPEDGWCEPGKLRAR